jgi:Icc-related predicted phosphoesterase
MKISLISDTHGMHNITTNDLVGGDMIIHSGDISNVGKPKQIEEFFQWFSGLPYTYKIVIAGNHDWGFKNKVSEINKIIEKYEDSIIYLQDEMVEIEGIKIYGSPWQPEFCDWAFNLPRNGEALKYVWSKIPEDVDILITHGPAFGHLDKVMGREENIGCEMLRQRIDIIKPKIHVFGHIHSGYGHKFNGETHFFNASVLDEAYDYTHPPLNFKWDRENNFIY